jgi:hypothetical protein
MVEKSHTRLEEEAKLCNKVNCKNKKVESFVGGSMQRDVQLQEASNDGA